MMDRHREKSISSSVDLKTPSAPSSMTEPSKEVFMKKRRLFPMVGLTVALSFIFLVCFACAGTQTGGVKNTVSIDPPAGVKGTKINIAGTGFKAGEEIDIVLIMGPGQRVGLGTEKVDAITADKDGSFTAQSNIPSWAKPGIYDIAVEGGTGSLVKTKLEVVEKK
jgi:hypothetical protein